MDGSNSEIDFVASACDKDIEEEKGHLNFLSAE